MLEGGLAWMTDVILKQITLFTLHLAELNLNLLDI